MNTQEVPLFAGLSAAALHVLERTAVVREFAPGAVLWRAGSTPRAVHIVLEGEVRVHQGSAERVRVLHTEKAGGTLGDVALFAGSSYPATAVAVSRTRCLLLDASAVAAAIQADPAFALRLMQKLAVRVQQLIERLERNTEWPVQSRLAAYLLERAEQAGERAFSLNQTQAELAEELGTVREVVVRTLRDLRERGLLLSAGRGRYRIPDIAALRALARRDLSA